MIEQPRLDGQPSKVQFDEAAVRLAAQHEKSSEPIGVLARALLAAKVDADSQFSKWMKWAQQVRAANQLF